jgi:hypothetical protein
MLKELNDIRHNRYLREKNHEMHIFILNNHVLALGDLIAAHHVVPRDDNRSPEATPEPMQKHKSNRLMREADTPVGPRERKPRKRKGRSPASA